MEEAYLLKWPKDHVESSKNHVSPWRQEPHVAQTDLEPTM